MSAAHTPSTTNHTLAVPAIVGLILAGTALFISLVAGTLGYSAGPAGFLLDGLSWTAFALPAYPWLGALIIAMPGFRVDLLVGLVASLAPLASMAFTARFLDNPRLWMGSMPALAEAGAAVVGVAGFGTTLALGMLVIALARLAGKKASIVTESYRLRTDSGASASATTDSGSSLQQDPSPAADRPGAPGDDHDEAGEYQDRVFDLSYPDLPPMPFLNSLGMPPPIQADLAATATGTVDASEESSALATPTDIDTVPEAEAVDEEEYAYLEELDDVPIYLPEPATAREEPSGDVGTKADEPIPLMFNRPRQDAGPTDRSAVAQPFTERKPAPQLDTQAPVELSGLTLDPALDAEYWSDSDEDSFDHPDTTRPAQSVSSGQPGSPSAVPASDHSRGALLPKVETFFDGQHEDAVRSGNKAAGSASIASAASTSKASTDPSPAGKSGPTVRPQVMLPPRRPGGKQKVRYDIPVEGILTSYPDGQYWIIDDKTRHAADVLRETLKEFGITAEVTGIRKGPVITMFEILPAPGVRLSKIANLSDNIALRLAASSVRIVAPIPGKHAVGIEVPNERRAIVSFREIVESETFRNAKMEVPVILGKDITGEVQVAELTQTPHLLIAGATGAGKSVSVNSIILSILYRRSFNEVKLILIDPKIVELKLYNGIPHLLTPVITEPKRAFQALQYCICEMERRYSLLDAMGVRDIKSYNRKIVEKTMATDKLPYIVVIIDEFADLMATTGKELESTLARLAAMSRAVGIHLVLATQRPSIDVITGLIKANIPSRIAFMVASKFDSRIIIDMVGAEKLLGRGDMLYSSATDAFPVRMQGAFVSEDEVERVVAHVKTLGEPDYIDEEIFVDDDDDEGPSLFDEEDDDPLYEKALEIVLSQGKASASFLQRKLKIGYNRAARLVELMEEKGIVGKAQGSKPRDVMMNPDIGRAPNPKARYVPDFGPDDDDGPALQDGAALQDGT